jgi:hypothetical protein
MRGAQQSELSHQSLRYAGRDMVCVGWVEVEVYKGINKIRWWIVILDGGGWVDGSMKV